MWGIWGDPPALLGAVEGRESPRALRKAQWGIVRA